MKKQTDLLEDICNQTDAIFNRHLLSEGAQARAMFLENIEQLLEATATRTRQDDIETINKLAPLASIGFNGETHYLISRAEAINSLNK